MTHIHSKEEILRYLRFEKRRTLDGKNYNGSIRPVAPNLHKDATESLGCQLILNGIILPQLNPIKTVERFVNKDIVVNRYHKLEVKATSSGDGTITPSDSNFDAFAWMWFDFKPFFYEDINTIPIHIMTNPKQCIHPDRYVETLRQSKLTISSAIRQSKRLKNHSLYNLNLETMEAEIDKEKKEQDRIFAQFFGI